MWKAPLAGFLVVASASLALGADNPWPRFTSPVPGPALSIGDYSAGCLQGGVPLPLDGPGYQVMRPSRRRYFGHPDLSRYVRELGRRVRAARLGVVLVGDLSQPRGGRAEGGHASHQTGLDVDLWFARPSAALRGPLPTRVRETLEPASVVDQARGDLRKAHRTRVERLLRLAVDSPRVDRVFVNPAIKRALCDAPGERSWLRKLRPWYGHDAHFHVRLGCPAGSPECKSQAPLPAGDGCDKLDFWFDPAAQKARADARKSYRQTISEGRGWPARCDQLLTTPSG